MLLFEAAFLAGFCFGRVDLAGFCFDCIVFLWGFGLLEEDLNTKNTAKDINYIIKCCEYCNPHYAVLIYILVLIL
jgi:hypothetical protein